MIEHLKCGHIEGYLMIFLLLISFDRSGIQALYIEMAFTNSFYRRTLIPQKPYFTDLFTKQTLNRKLESPPSYMPAY